LRQQKYAEVYDILDADIFRGKPTFGNPFYNRHDAMSYLIRLTDNGSYFLIEKDGVFDFKKRLIVTASIGYDERNSMNADAASLFDMKEPPTWMFVFSFVAPIGGALKISSLSAIEGI
jgi:hypothetical protein